MDMERIVLVNQLGRPTGDAPKLESHHANTPMHLAFSSYIFNTNGQLLVTQRADSKKVWPGVWTNTCCGHPAPAESMTDAINRRLAYELGMTGTNITEIISDYSYKTPPYRGVIENEWCPIYAGIANTDPVPNPAEVMGWRWVSWDEYQVQLSSDNNDIWSWWCKDQLKQLLASGLFKKYTAQ